MKIAEFNYRVIPTLLAAACLIGVSDARASTIEFVPTSANPNPTGAANTAAYGSDANVSVGYSPYAYSYYSGYGTIDAGSGAAIYSDNYNPVDGLDDLVMTFTAAAGYVVTLNSFDLATYHQFNEINTISVTGGSTAYNLTTTPDTNTFSTYLPNVTGSVLTLTISNLYDVGLNTISFSETAVAAVPEPASWVMMLVGFGAIGFAARTRNRQVVRVTYA